MDLIGLVSSFFEERGVGVSVTGNCIDFDDIWPWIAVYEDSAKIQYSDPVDVFVSASDPEFLEKLWVWYRDQVKASITPPNVRKWHRVAIGG